LSAITATYGKLEVLKRSNCQKKSKTNLIRRLISKIERLPLRAPKQQHPSARRLIINSTNMQRCIPRSIATVHIGAIHKQIFQVLRQTVATGLIEKSISNGEDTGKPIKNT
jgi:hypothetical protein